jgi:signal transduction histidine kinase
VLENEVTYWIQDNGRGLTTAEQEMLFIEFTRIEAQRADGHGLGLSIVKRIADKLGGRVGVESTIGEGCRFYFTLPTSDKQKLPTQVLS